MGVDAQRIAPGDLCQPSGSGTAGSGQPAQRRTAQCHGHQATRMTQARRLTDPRDRGGPAQPLLLVRDLKKYFPAKGHLLTSRREMVQAVDGVSFSVMKGTTLGVVGESGCGKSTTARLLLHLIE